MKNKEILDEYQRKKFYGPDICRCRECSHMVQTPVFSKHCLTAIEITCGLPENAGREITLDGFCESGERRDKE